ncbi:polysaccharide deacetylase family protein [Streptomyces albidoflavus]|uniref:polysaccharide deacetylase family protein n=1 Tax=Streptomyces TaxID=1883 RepID=UPI001436A380|nr:MULTISPECIES: polysaccharide deacetylase family protein [Streptomyces]MBV7253462.1 polysaccharide deacetylase family protein [Streptomyces sp. S-2]MCL6277107.1 polysaccharide deacetylase family protein [Streptomyces albidoflavus]MCX4467566.1 polysaccharide deacetylase family protein [Streptomyces albidoflavus]WSI91137.1 polysaccharide deacetylase family protein [Streptomyces albidoflavus]WTC40826.1 polysaccharide deacetylase family protein [Streptomyces albidoflavus]
MSGDLLSRYPPGGGALRERAARAPAGEAGGRARGPEDQPVPILMYHAVTRSPAAATRALSVTPDAFAEQMAMVTAYGCTPLTAAQLANRWRTGRPLPPRPVLITFDDGYEGVHRHALPVLAELALPATVFVTTGWLRGLHEAGGAPDRMLDWGQVRELAAAGVEIGGHSHTHPQLDQLTPGRLATELAYCRELVGAELGAPPASFAYPFGYSDRRVRQAVRAAGYAQSLAVGNVPARRAQGPYALRRVTVRRSTGPELFGRLLECRALARAYAPDRALTRGYAVVRRARQARRKAIRSRD